MRNDGSSIRVYSMEEFYTIWELHTPKFFYLALA